MRMRAERCQMRSVTPGVRALKNKRGVESVQHPQSLQLAGPCAKMHWSVSKDVCCAHDARVQLDDNAQSRDMSAPCRQVRSCTFNRYHVRSNHGATHLQHNFAQAPGSARSKGDGVGVDLFAQTCCAHTRRLGAHPSHSRAACCDRVRRWPALMLRAKSARPPERPPATPGQRSCARRWASARHRARAAGLPRALSPTIPGCRRADVLLLPSLSASDSPRAEEKGNKVEETLNSKVSARSWESMTTSSWRCLHGCTAQISSARGVTVRKVKKGKERQKRM